MQGVQSPPGARKAGSTIRFREVDGAAGIAFTHVSGNSPDKHYPTANGSGVAMIDYDGDGRLDLYFATTRNFPHGRADNLPGEHALSKPWATGRSRT